MERMSEAFYRLDLYAANPSWRINSQYHTSTWKSIFATFLVVAASVGLSLSDLSYFWKPTSQLPTINHFFQKGDTAPLSPYWIALNFSKPYNTSGVEIWVRGGQAVQQACPDSLSAMPEPKICFVITSSELPMDESKEQQDNLMEIRVSDPADAEFNLWMEKFSLNTIFERKNIEFFTADKTCSFTSNNDYSYSFSKSKMYISDSLLKEDYSQTVSRMDRAFTLDYTFWQGNLTWVPFFDTRIGVSYSGYISETYYIRRELFLEILSAFISWLQFLVVAMLLIFLSINNANAKLQLSKAMFTNEEIHRAQVSLFFILKKFLLELADLLRWKSQMLRLREKGQLKVERMCRQAEKRVDNVTQVQRILQRLSLCKYSVRPRNEEDITTVKTLDYNLEPEKLESEELTVKTVMLYVGKSGLPSGQGKKVSTLGQRPHWLGRFLRFWDFNTIPIQFAVNQKQKSSVFSIGVTYAWIIGAFVLLNFVGTFSYGNSVKFYQRNINKNSQTVTWNFTQQPLYFRRKDPWSDPPLFSVELRFNGAIVRNITLETNCPPPPAQFKPTQVPFEYCFLETINFTATEVDSHSLEIYLSTSDPATYNFHIETLSLLIRQNYTEAAYQIWSPVPWISTVETYRFFKVLQGNQSLGLVVPSDPDNKQTKRTSNLVNKTHRIVLTPTSAAVTQLDRTVNFFDSCDSVWNLTLIFGALLIYLISKPYNRSVARKALAEHISTSDSHIETILDTSKLLLYLRAKESKMGSERRFFKTKLEYEE